MAIDGKQIRDGSIPSSKLQDFNGLDPKEAVRLATTGALSAYTYNNGTSGVGATITANANGALTLDTITPSVNDRVLVKDETAGNAPYNGIYVVTQVGDMSHPFILTRAADNNSSTPVPPQTIGTIAYGNWTYVADGSVNKASNYVLTGNGTIVVGTTPLTWSQSGGPSAPASALQTSGSPVNVSAASPPIAGKVLTATDATHATWQTPLAFSANKQTLSGDVVLTSNSVQGQYLDPNGADRNVKLPAGATGLYFYVKNIGSFAGGPGAWNRLIVRDSSNVLVAVVTPGVQYLFIWDGSGWECPTNPKQNPRLWLAADTTVYNDTIFSTPAGNGDPVKSWKNIANTQEGVLGASTWPTLVTNVINGKPVVRFVTTNSVLKSVFVAGGAPSPTLLAATTTVLAVLARPNWNINGTGGAWPMFLTTHPNGGSVGVICSLYSSGGTPGFGISMFGYNSINSLSGGQPTAAIVPPVLVGSSFHLVGMDAGHQSGVWVDGAVPASYQNLENGVCASSDTQIPQGQFYVGGDGAGDIFDGDIAELLCFSGELSIDQRCFWSQYLADKYALSIVSG